MISNLTETLMCLIKEKCDSTHERTGELGGCQPPTPPPHKFWSTQIFRAAKEILAKPISFRLFFFERDIC